MMLNAIRNSKFKIKIIVLIAMIIIVNGFISGILFSTYAAEETIDNYCESSENLIWQLNEQIAKRMYGITKKVYAINNNLSYVDAMNKLLSDTATVNYAVTLGDISDIISELVGSDEFISYAFIHTRVGDFDNFINIRNREVTFENTEMFKHYVENPKDVIAWFPAGESKMYKTNEIVIPISYRFRFGTDNIYTVVAISKTKLDEYVRDILDTYDKVYILDENNNTIIGDEKKGMIISNLIDWTEVANRSAKCKKIKLEDGEFLITASIINSNGWKIMAVKNTDSLTFNIHNLRIFVAIELLMSTAICILISIILVRKMTKPLSELAIVMKSDPIKNEGKIFEYKYNDEVGELANSFNLMIQEINNNIKELEREKEAKRVAELKALQAQINPHFLYNTLNAITWQAADQGVMEISVLSNSLGKFFRLSLNHGKELISIADEFEHVKCYLEIQKIRYKSKFEYAIDLKDYIRDLMTIKLVIQPLVENSIYHGIKELNRNGKIKITAERYLNSNGSPIIHIIVEDDGKGISQDKLTKINNLLSEGKTDDNTGYGIFNVNERIKLYYGKEYGLKLESVENLYTRAILTLPEHINGGQLNA